jgi:DNA-directed RNA polymerase specialized sigma24 family protein
MIARLRESIAKARKLPKSADLLIARAELLAPRDRALVEAVMLNHQTAEEIGLVAGINPRTIRYRIHKLTKRMSSQRFLDAARLLLYLQPHEAEVVRRYYCQGQSLRLVAADMGMTLHQVRREIDRLHGEMAFHRREQARRKLETAELANMLAEVRPLRGG